LVLLSVLVGKQHKQRARTKIEETTLSEIGILQQSTFINEVRAFLDMLETCLQLKSFSLLAILNYKKTKMTLPFNLK
jgi:hypothetical protein